MIESQNNQKNQNKITNPQKNSGDIKQEKTLRPESFSDLNEGLYKPYKYGDGPKINLNINSRKFFGTGFI